MKKNLKYLLIIGIIISLYIGFNLIESYNIKNEGNNEEKSYEQNNLNKLNYVEIKYKEDKVNLNNNSFEYLDTSKSSWIRGAWYDSQEKYMIIDLNGTKYNYYGMPNNVWEAFKRADSFGTFYNKNIKGIYDYREN